MLGPSSGDSKTSTAPVLGINSASGDGVNNFSTKTHQVSETNYNIGGSNSISAGDEEDRVGVIDNNSSAKVEEVDRSFGGNRWPRQETLALLQIRSDMDVAFRDATIKAPLWDAVSRKLAELGYNRSAKKCKEKFENVYKYHKRTKEGRSGKPDGKTYRFFDQLKALENQPPSSSSPSPHNNQPKTIQQIQAPSATMVVTSMINNPPLTVSHQNTTVPSVSHQQPNTINLTFPPFQTPTNPTILPPSSTFHPSITTTTTTATAANANTSAFQSISAELFSNSTSSSTSSDEQVFEGSLRRNKKRKWKDFFERLMVEVIQKQEELQNKFLEAIEKREHERMVREEAWRMQEISRIRREREILSQERSMAAAKDAAVLAFLQKISEQQNPNPNPNIGTQPQNIILQTPVQLTVTSPMTGLTQPLPLPQPQPQQMLQPRQANVENTPTTKQAAAAENNEQHNELMPASSSRWPKVEIEALIKLRTTLDAKYQENSPKGPLWEEISGSMKELGYNRNAKRCKEKWENINKYYKKVKESNKKRPEDSKTCPYFSQLEALYKEKNKFENTQMNNQIMKSEINSIPIMVRPEQQWPPQQENNNNEEDDPMDQNQEEDDRDGDEDEDEEDDESDGNYELVANKSANNNNNNVAVSSATAV